MLKKSLREMTDKERPLKLVQHFRLQEKFKKIAAWHKLNLAISLAYPSGKEGGHFTRSNDFYLPSLRLMGGGGGLAPFEKSMDRPILNIMYFLWNTGN